MRGLILALAVAAASCSCASPSPQNLLQLGTCYPIPDKAFHVRGESYSALSCPGGVIILVPDERERSGVRA